MSGQVAKAFKRVLGCILGNIKKDVHNMGNYIWSKNINRIVIFFLFIFSYSSLAFCNEISKEDFIGRKNQFEINETFYFIEFINETEFTFH